MDQGDKQNRIRLLSSMGMLSSIGIYFGVSISLGLFFGLYLDKKLGTAPIFFMIFMAFGIIAGFVNLFRLTTRLYKDKDEDNDK